MRKMVVKIRKNATFALKYGMKLYRDPYGVCCGKPEGTDFRPITDSLSSVSYMQPLLPEEQPAVFSGEVVIM